MRELVRLADHDEEFRRKGARVFALGVGQREDFAELQAEVAPGVTLLADPQAAAVSAFGMLDPDPFPRGKVMARAGTVLIGADGVVMAWWLTDNYRKRPEPSEILAGIP